MLAYLNVLFASIATGTKVPAVQSRRGATFIEYMLLAAIAVGIFIILTTFFSGAFDGIFNRIRDALN